MLRSHRTVRPMSAGATRLATGAPAASRRSTGSGSGASTTRICGPDVPLARARSVSPAEGAGASAVGAVAAGDPPWPRQGATCGTSRSVAAAPSDAMSRGPTADVDGAEPPALAEAAAPPAAPPPAASVPAAVAAPSPALSPARSFVSRQSANWPSSLVETSASTPRPNWATRPVMVRSVTTAILVPSPSGSSCAVMVALALPWPLVSRPSARSTARCAASSFSTKRAAPLYCAVMGPTLTLTMPRYSSPSISWSCAPGMHGAIRSTSVSTSHACSTGTPTRNSLVSSTTSAPFPQVVDRIDVCGTSRTRYFHHQVRPTTHHDPGALVPRRRQERPDERRQADRVAPRPPVRRHPDRLGPGLGHALPRLREHQRLVPQAHHHGVVAVAARPGQACPERRCHPVAPRSEERRVGKG